MNRPSLNRPALRKGAPRTAAAVVYLTAAEELTLTSTILVVWNPRYNGWTLPGGMIEPDESVMVAAWRELTEETALVEADLTPAGLRPMYSASAEPSTTAPDRAGYVYVSRGETAHPERARENERGCPVEWVTQDEFLHRCPFRTFYETMFRRLLELRRGQP